MTGKGGSDPYQLLCNVNREQVKREQVRARQFDDRKERQNDIS